MDLFDKCQRYDRDARLKAAGIYPYFHPIEQNHCTQVTIGGRRLIQLGSNNYLGLTHHPKVMEAARAALAKYGTGCTGSRFLNGTLDLHVELEQGLASFMGKEAAIVFSTGFQTNLGAISALVAKDDWVFCDRENHASIIDGCRLGLGKLKKFRHNDFAELERQLAAAPEGPGGKLIVVDGVFSMTGVLTDLPRALELKKKYGARILLDDAHSIGVLGAGGRGTAEYYGVMDEVDLIMGTFSKSFAAIGGFVAGPARVINFMRHTARALIFSAAMPPASVASVKAALEVIRTEPERRARLQANADRIRAELKALGFETGTSLTPVVPIIVGEEEVALRFWAAVFEGGVFTNGIIPPATPPGRSLLRTSCMASHTDDELSTALNVFATRGRALGLVR